jgi:predicted O-methyltransferase YrrM
MSSVSILGSPAELDRLKRELAEALSDVEGWLDLDEAWSLHEAARCSWRSRRELTAVEIGSFMGRSTIALALGLRARNAGRLWAVDPHSGSEQTISLCGEMDTYDVFIANLKKAGVMEFVEPMRTTSQLARGQFVDGSVHLLHVDGSQEYEAVRQYFDDWCSALADGAVVAFRDPLDNYAALRHRVLRSHSPFRRPRHVQGLLWVEVRRSQRWTTRDRLALLLLASQRLIHNFRKTATMEEHLPARAQSTLEALETLPRERLSRYGAG